MHIGFGRDMRRADIAAEMAARRALMDAGSADAQGLPEAAGCSHDEPHGAGWHESSWELRRGLEVREGMPADLSLAEWRCLWA